MKEELLHTLWKLKRMDFSELYTTEGELVVIKNFGIHNHNSGPDFLNAQIKIGDTLWNGHVEMHLKASDWQAHNHQTDPAYNNVILHVVYTNNKNITNEQRQSIPTVEMSTRIEPSLIKHYNNLIGNLTWIPCEKQLADINKERIPFFLERLVIQRQIRKQIQIKEYLTSSKNDWEEILYKLLLKYLGLKVNNTAFARLGEILPYSLLKKQDSLLKKESLLLGQAGLLKGTDPYIDKLRNEYKHQKAKYTLTPMTGVEWQFSKLRPANFPSLRMAQLAAIYDKTPKFFTEITQKPTLAVIRELLSVTASTFWDTHYLPNKTSAKRKKSIGKGTKDILIINVIVPLLFCYAEAIADEQLKEQAIDLLYQLPAEKNNIIKRWQAHDIDASSAAQSQALIELKTNYCDKQNCLECQIGQQILFS